MIETVSIPVEWRKHVHPRRGGVAGPEVVPDGRAALRAREWERAARPIAAEMADHEHTDAELGKAVRARLAGEADPVGAAVLAAVAVKYLGGVDGAAFVDAWVLDHGVAFAACALTEVSSVALGPEPKPVTPDSDGVVRLVAYLSGNGPKGWRGEIRRVTSQEHFGVGRWIAEDAVVKRLRALLAAASDDEYGDAVARLAAHRGDPARRCTASYLVPTEVGWMDESLDDPSQAVLGHEHVLCSLSTAAHVRRIGWIRVSPAVLATLLDGLGADALPLLEHALDHGHHDIDEARPLVLKALLEIADEGLFPVLLGHLGTKGVPEALQEAARRYPVEAVRSLGPFVREETVRGLQAAGLVRGLLHAEPELAKELPPGAVEELSPLPGVREWDDLPAALVGKPARGAKTDWADPAALPRILAPGRDRALPVDATKYLLGLLARKAPEAAYVRGLCDRHSLAEFSWAVFQRWYALGAPSKHNWALAQLGLIGDDTTVRRLAPLIRQWPGDGGSSRAVAALDVLAGIGSDVALTHLFELTRRGKYKGLKAKAEQKIGEIAAARRITPDDLADRAVPDFGLGPEGTLVLDYGPRQFTMTFDEQLAPLVVEANGKVRKSAPKPGPKDDPTLAPAAHALFSGLRKDLRTITDQEVKRLEKAMTARRSWTPGDFRALFVDHPLLGHIVRRLVWTTGDGTAFRVAEDRTYADLNDDTFTPAPDARIGIAHPLLLGDDLGAWVDLFADYEILQPFAQLGRPVYRLTDDERSARSLARVEGLVLPYGKAKGHSQGRWESVDARGEFAGGWLARRDPAGLHVVASLSPGLGHYMYGEGEDQKITALWAGRSPARTPQNPVPLGDVDEVTMSEAIHDLVRSASTP
ncbi:DUF4132 domain-containing protein [Yinghuangia seranimata]|uniref:DUF4132 domain-containing protein n=1 Tax=Yinghuangia seranimata TaxID=408067 RepID=UPI00248B4529|nr:DUF4132 domain-containing protein [Yinghuangia seranimata]MDI2128424.1 DUF4132 domain-containing protein [Yinghuangia seranimata]